jgi:3-hydroxyacyl-CoA dehydrogenase
MSKIQKIVVIGSGIMGSGIAAHLANAQCSVLLLDLPVEEGRNKLANEAIDRMKKQKPAPLMDPKFAHHIVTGNTEDDLEKILDYDWVIEVIIEKLESKQALYKKIDDLCSGKIIVSSNTSSIKLADLVAGRSEAFRSNFFITHFFNPPRYMRLLEFVTHQNTNQEAVEKLAHFADEKLGKTVIFSHDRPAFIGNRIGTYVSFATLDEALHSNLTLNQIDKIFTKAFDVPKTGVFALFDLVGLDVMYFVGNILIDNLPANDAIHKMDTKTISDLFKDMITQGYTGRKGLGGFFRMREEKGSKIKEVLDLKTREYKTIIDQAMPSLALHQKSINDFLMLEDEAARFARKVIFDAFYYVSSVVPEITDDLICIDRAIRLGFGWKLGPFEMMDNIGPSWIREQFKAEGREIPGLLALVGESTFYKIVHDQKCFLTPSGSYKPIIRPAGIVRLKDLKGSKKPLLENPGARLWDIGDGAVCFEFKTKENTFTPDIFEMIHQTIDLVKKEYKAVVIHNETENFSLGMNLDLAVEMSTQPNYDLNAIEFMRNGQNALMSLKLAPFPVVGAPAGMAIGGGCELLLHCDAIVAHAELYMGLVEIGLGIVPGWGGCKELLLRADESLSAGALLGFKGVFETVGSAKVSTSAYHAQQLMYLRPTDTIVMNRDRVLFEAKKRALSLVAGYSPPAEKKIRLPGKLGFHILKLAIKSLGKSGKISDYDRIVLEKLAYIITGGTTTIFSKSTERQLLELEVQMNQALSYNQPTRDRFLHYVNTGKILRN